MARKGSPVNKKLHHIKIPILGFYSISNIVDGVKTKLSNLLIKCPWDFQCIKYIIKHLKKDIIIDIINILFMLCGIKT